MSSEKRETWRRFTFLFALLLALVYVVTIITGVVDKDDRLGTPEIILLVALLILTAYVVEEFAFGPTGFSARLKRLDDRQEELASQVKALDTLLQGLVTKWELIHLEHLDAKGPYFVRFSDPMLRELDRLGALGFTEPLDAEKGLQAIEVHNSTADHFDLKQYVKITPEGRGYLRERALWRSRAHTREAD